MNNIPAGLSEKQVVEILTKVSMRIARNKKYIFDGHEAEDIVQRGIYEGLRCISNGLYNAAKCKGSTAEESLERFMSVHIRNRLSNYKRDMLRKNNTGTERGIVNPVSLTDLVVMTSDRGDHVDDAIYKEIIVKIKSKLSATPDMLTDFYRLMDGSTLPSQRKNRLRQRIVEILEDIKYGVQEED